MNGLVRLKRLMVVLAVAAVVAWLPTGAEATITYTLDFVFSGDQPANSGPWGTISFTTVGSDTLVTMTALGGATGLASGEFITFWGFNTTDTSFSAPSTLSGAATGTIAVCPTDPCTSAGFKADGDGFYDIVVSFETANNAGRLTSGESVSFTILGATEGSFSPLSNPGGGAGTYNTAMHIQGIAGSSCSAWVGNSTSTGAVGGGTGTACASVPEPASLLLLGSGLLGVFFTQIHRTRSWRH
jgi:hypothetical protein